MNVCYVSNINVPSIYCFILSTLRNTILEILRKSFSDWILSLLFFFFFNASIWNFPGQGLYPSHSHNLTAAVATWGPSMHCAWARPGIEPVPMQPP